MTHVWFIYKIDNENVKFLPVESMVRAINASEFGTKAVPRNDPWRMMIQKVYVNVGRDRHDFFSHDFWKTNNDLLVISACNFEKEDYSFDGRLHFFNRNVPIGPLQQIRMDKVFCPQNIPNNINELECYFFLGDLDYVPLKKWEKTFKMIGRATSALTEIIASIKPAANLALDAAELGVGFLAGWNRIEPILGVSCTFGLPTENDQGSLEQLDKPPLLLGEYLIISESQPNLDDYSLSPNNFLIKDNKVVKDFSYIIISVNEAPGYLNAAPVINYLHGSSMQELINQIHDSLILDEDNVERNMEDLLTNAFEEMGKFIILKEGKNLIEQIGSEQDDVKKVQLCKTLDKIKNKLGEYGDLLTTPDACSDSD